MVSLQRSWVKPGVYLVSPLVDFNFETTQQFHDNFIDLTAIIDKTIDKAKDKLRQLHLHQQPVADEKSLSSWSDANFESFVITSLMFGSSDDDIKRRFKQLLQRDRITGILTTLHQFKALKRNNKSQFVAKSAQIKQLAKLVNSNDYYIDHQISGYGWSRMRDLSATLQSTDKQQRQFQINLNAETKNLSWKSLNDKDDGANNGTRRSLNNDNSKDK